MKLPVYSRADLSRTVALVGALFLTAASTSVVARVFRAAATQNKDYPTVRALRYTDSAVAERDEQTRAGAIDRNRTNVALIGNFVLAKNVLAMPFLFRSVEHLQKLTDEPIGNEILNSFDPYQRDPATAEPIERIRKVE
jgi:TRAP-type C4-dicarboxylate transport system substrate-binding protein